MNLVVNLANVSIAPKPDDFDLSTRTGLIAGGALLIYLGPSFNLQVEPGYIQRDPR